MELLFLVLFSLHILKTEVVVGQHWCYLSQKNEEPTCEDPRHWHAVDANCKGSKQSPINIVTKNVIYDKSLTPLYFENYDVKETSKWTIENNGHTVKVTLSTHPKIEGGGLNRRYKAVEFHLHWGVQEEQLYFPGSEHSIDGEKQAMELHIVHIREDALDLTDAKNYADGIAVLAFFIKIDEENKNYTTLISELDNILQKDTSSQMEPLPLNSLLPPTSELEKYYRYEGSLTTPDCHETVIWTVFEKPIQLSLWQVSQFSSVHFGGTNSTLMSENFRPAQFLNGRYVYWSGASSLLPPAHVLMLALILLYLLNSLFQ
ncbi:carbonic anhydrase 4 [Tympanuchus pallidicinctus]|uniref:carbonic anhydrase 4 n=1 Tax=Tympanuchus pallidicinctus TaxID=109042 RepID=UPI002286CEEE|nr:carbonic anhydrase 4 [Tympanuchus pallidicinctus]